MGLALAAAAAAAAAAFGSDFSEGLHQSSDEHENRYVIRSIVMMMPLADILRLPTMA